jgi:hypothetical protein
MYAGGDVYCIDYPFIAPVLIMLTVYVCICAAVDVIDVWC